MESNQNIVQDQVAQLIIPELRQSEPQPTKPLYNPDEVAEIVRHLTSGSFDPQYILLFGKLAGGTPFSDIAAYDLLVVFREPSAYHWNELKHHLRLQMPLRCREIASINIYQLSLKYVKSDNTPFLYFTHSEGELLYCKEGYHFKRPKHSVNFSVAYADAQHFFNTFHEQGMLYLERAKEEYIEHKRIRTAALCLAQASVYFYYTLYYVYHGMEFDNFDLLVMHERMHTLSSELILAMDNYNRHNTRMISHLRRFQKQAAYERKFDISSSEMEMYMQSVGHLSDIVRNMCDRRLKLYLELSQK